MGVRPNNTVYWTVQCSKEERDTINAAAKAAGTNRNRFVREFIASLPVPKPDADNGG